MSVVGLAIPAMAQSVLATVPVGSGPRAVAVNPSTNKIYVANDNGNSVAVIDGATNAVTTVPTGVSPYGIAINQVTNKIYVTNSGSNFLTVIDGATNATTSVPVGLYATGIGVNPVTNRIYVGSGPAGAVVVIDGATNTIVDSIYVAGQALIFAVNPVTNQVYVLLWASYNFIVQIDGATGAKTAIPAGTYTFDMGINTATNKIYVVDFMGTSLSVIDGATGARTAVDAGDSAVAVAVNQVTNKVYVINQVHNQVTVVDGATNATTPITVDPAPTALAADAAANKVYVATGSNHVTVIDGATNATVSLPTGFGSRAVAVNSATGRAYVANFDSNTVTVIGTQQPQTILFPDPGAQTVGGSATLTATASSGLPVTLSSLSPVVCTVSGNTAHFLAVGTCTLAADQAGTVSISAAHTTRSFEVAFAPLGAPQNLVCAGGLGQINCSFSPPLVNAGAGVVSGYILNCAPISGNTAVSVSGNASPLALTGVKPGVMNACTVSATNAQGLGSASNIAYVTAYSATARGNGIDSNGDGAAEVVVRTGSGASFMATLNNQSQLTFSPSPDPGPNWKVLGAGDFGGRGRSDLLMQDTQSGMVKVWAGFQGPPDSEYLLRTVKPGWVVAAITDIDGDGKADILWRYYSTPANPSPNPDDNGVAFVWFMNGSAIDAISARGGAPVSWSLAGAADLHGNGRSDMVWVSPANAIRSITALPGRAFANELIGTVPAGYTLVRLGDFDGDGKADLLFRNAQGKMKLWLMNGITLKAEVNLPDSDPAFQIYSTGDFNGDGTRDIVFLRTDSTLLLWLMNAATPQAPTVILNAGTAPAGAAAIAP